MIDDKIADLNNGLKFVLQVWKLGGQMVFEKSLLKPVCNWNITQDKFMFQEDVDDPNINVISMKDDCLPKIYRFILPQSVIDGGENVYYDVAADKFEIPDDIKEIDYDDMIIDL